METMQNKPDRRVVRTKRMIRQALIKLLSECDYHNISITDITEVADINRKTFYNHYTAVHEIIEEIENEIVEEFTVLIEGMDLMEELKNPYNLLNSLSTIMFKAIDTYGSILKQEHSLALLLKFAEKLKEAVIIPLKKQTKLPKDVLNIYVEYIFIGMLAVYRRWLLAGQKQSLKEVSDILSTLSISAFEGLSKIRK